MKMMKTTLGLLAGLLLFFGTASATSIDEAIKLIFKDPSGVKVVSIRDDLKLGNFVPILLEINGKPKLTYFDGDFIVTDNILPVNTASRIKLMAVMSSMNKEIDKLALANRYGTDTAKWKKVLDRTSSTEGSGTEIYVFHDPFCHFCDKLYTDTRSAVNDGKLKIHWIPVSILRKESMNVAAYINKNNDNLKTWHTAANKSNMVNYIPSEDEIREVSTATDLFNSLHLSGTPTILYPHDGIVDTIGGYLPLKSLLGKLKNLKNSK